MRKIKLIRNCTGISSGAFVRVRVARKQLGEIPDRTPRASRALGTGNEAPGHGLASQLTVEPQLDVARHKRRTGR